VNLVGTTHGADQTFSTPDVPQIAEVGSSAVRQTSARLSGIVTPMSSPTMAHFEYGPSGSFGQSTPETFVGSGTEQHNLAADLAGLSPGTTYSFRLVATNAIGTSVSPAGTFTTVAAASGALLQGEQAKPIRCRRGFVKRKARNGKVRCVKRKKKTRSGRRG
jgi:hypothetical protein